MKTLGAVVLVLMFTTQGQVAHAALAGGTVITRASGWTRVGFPLADSALGVMLQVDGRAQLGRIEIVFEDGDLQRVEAAPSHVYGRGTYPLATFTNSRRVLAVRMAARARSQRTGLRVLLVRESDPPAEP